MRRQTHHLTRSRTHLREPDSAAQGKKPGKIKVVCGPDVERSPAAQRKEAVEVVRLFHLTTRFGVV
jgi:hypothetical protein